MRALLQNCGWLAKKETVLPVVRACLHNRSAVSTATIRRHFSVQNNGAGTMSEQYARAVQALNSLVTGRKRGVGWAHSFESTFLHLERLGLAQQLQDLSVVHVAGTKGKGSTCAMVESMLRACGYRTGLFTSPHLCSVTERIRINGAPISEDVFSQYFWSTYNTLQSQADDKLGMPFFFKFLTLLALRVFLSERVDVAILEVGIGGRLDSTNVIPSPVVCGVSHLGFDHMELLGNTLKEIAFEKAGIFKAGSLAFTVPQEEEAMQSLQQQAAKIGIPLVLSRPLSTFRLEKGGEIVVGMAGEHQAVNAALAVALAGAWEEQEARVNLPGKLERVEALKAGILPQPYADGLRQARWPGRCEVFPDPLCAENITYYLDGAHTPESMVVAANWFAEATARKTENKQQDPAVQPPTEEAAKKVLLFHCTADRNHQQLLEGLLTTLHKHNLNFSYALFVPPDSLPTQIATGNSEINSSIDLSWHTTLQSTYASILTSLSTTAGQNAKSPEFGPLQDPPCPLPDVSGFGAQDPRRGAVLPRLGQAQAWLRECGEKGAKFDILVTGSLYHVGDMLIYLGQQP